MLFAITLCPGEDAGVVSVGLLQFVHKGHAAGIFSWFRGHDVKKVFCCAKTVFLYDTMAFPSGATIVCPRILTHPSIIYSLKKID
jgi:hypothetical protein